MIEKLNELKHNIPIFINRYWDSQQWLNGLHWNDVSRQFIAEIKIENRGDFPRKRFRFKAKSNSFILPSVIFLLSSNIYFLQRLFETKGSELFGDFRQYVVQLLVTLRCTSVACQFMCTTCISVLEIWSATYFWGWPYLNIFNR